MCLDMQMLAFTQHRNLRIAILALPFWSNLLHAADAPTPKTKGAAASAPAALSIEVLGALSNMAGALPHTLIVHAQLYRKTQI